MEILEPYLFHNSTLRIQHWTEIILISIADETAQMTADRGCTKLTPGSPRAWNALTPALSEWILDATSSMGFTKMTPVQVSTIPLFMTHKDVVVEAVTGSGKTLAFLIPLVEKLLRLEEPIKKHHVGAIIVSPTRELATQIYNVLLSLLKFHSPSAGFVDQSNVPVLGNSELNKSKQNSSTFRVVPQLLLGGSTTSAQDLSWFLKNSPNLLISTPGRLLEILSSPYVHCPQSSFEMLVLDEADRLLDLGFKDDLQRILAHLPKQRRTGLFSASVSEAVDQIIRVGLRNPVRIAVKVKGANGAVDKRTPASLRMTYSIAKPSQKWPALKILLQRATPSPLKVIVYLSTCAAVDYFQYLLPSEILPDGMILVPLHGKHPSNVREKNFIRFNNAACPALLLTTDVAARGLDIPQVDLVVQIDPPSDPKVFLHRCGRAGRAGRKGLSLIFLQPGREEDYIPFLEVRKTPVEELIEPDIRVQPGEAERLASSFSDLVLKDRALHDKAQKAFVSWVRSYSKHQASSIFRVTDLEWADLAQGWGLLKLPKMPELKGWDRKNYKAEEVDWNSYAYRDKQREQHRREALLQEKSGEALTTKVGKPPKRTSSTAWSQNLEHKADKEARRIKRQARRDHDRFEQMSQEERDRVAETEQMIEKVKQRNQTEYAADEIFEGFD
jgi:ATP-dependent RNA helicase DDX55/SPB4